MPPPSPLVWLWDYIFQRKSLNEASNTIYSLLQTQPLVASHQLMISFTFSFGYIKLGYQSSSVPTVFCIWIICIWSKDTQRSQNLETTIAPKFKVQNRPKNSPKNRHNGTVFACLSQKLAPTRKLAQLTSTFSTILRLCSTDSLRHQRRWLKGPEYGTWGKFLQSYRQSHIRPV